MRPSAGSVTTTARVALRWPIGASGKPCTHTLRGPRSWVASRDATGVAGRRAAGRRPRRRTPGRGVRGWWRRSCRPARSRRRRRPRSGWCAPASRRGPVPATDRRGRSSIVHEVQPPAPLPGRPVTVTAADALTAASAAIAIAEATSEASSRMRRATTCTGTPPEPVSATCRIALKCTDTADPERSVPSRSAPIPAPIPGPIPAPILGPILGRSRRSCRRCRTR
jgi:hypothetical protein